jgi:hypothetical protein
MYVSAYRFCSWWSIEISAAGTPAHRDATDDCFQQKSLRQIPFDKSTESLSLNQILFVKSDRQAEGKKP